VLIAVALDTAGAPAVRDFIRPEPSAEVPAFVADLMCWDRSFWDRAGTPSYPCLIDRDHVLAELYGVVNVPMAVWIDEEGRIVRPAEPAGTSDVFRDMDPATFKLSAEAVTDGQLRRRIYVDALLDWIERGPASPHALSPEEVRRRTHGPSESEALAMAHFRAGAWLHRNGHRDAARRHVQEAVRLEPASWSFLRQSIVLADDALTGQFGASAEYFDALQKLGENHYYLPIDMQGMPPPRPVRPRATPS
jgi:hypothetical protein